MGLWMISWVGKTILLERLDDRRLHVSVDLFVEGVSDEEADDKAIAECTSRWRSSFRCSIRLMPGSSV